MKKNVGEDQMLPVDFYNDKKENKRNLDDGIRNERNCHNFIKSILIQNYVNKNDNVLDIGCGHVGDILKLKKCNIGQYTGIDVSSKSLEIAVNRIFNTNLTFMCRLKIVDICKNWNLKEIFDVINCQFSLHYICTSEEAALQSMQNISNHLKIDGFLIGTIPTSNNQSFTLVESTLPNDDRIVKEPCICLDDFVRISKKTGFSIIRIEYFDTFYVWAYKNNTHVAKLMKADRKIIQEKSFVFVLQKTQAHAVSS